ncbi:smalltalk protein [Prevotella aurantiaca]|nr:smalltalk protein [Prevotella aurantiaca]
MKKEKWKFIIQIVLSVLSAIATTLGMGSCK